MSNKKINIANKLKAVGSNFKPQKGEWERVKEEERRGKTKAPLRLQGLSHAAQMALARDKASGMPNSELSDKYGVSMTYVEDALKSIFTSSEEGKRILAGVLLDNALASGMHARTKVEELTGMQAAMSTKIFTSAFIELEKHQENKPKTIDVSKLGEVQKILQDITDEVGLDDEDVGSILDSQVE